MNECKSEGLPAPLPIPTGPTAAQLQTLKTSNTQVQPPDSARMHAGSPVTCSVGSGVCSAAPEQLSERGKSGWSCVPRSPEVLLPSSSTALPFPRQAFSV